MSAREFHVGEMVDVTIRGARVEEITERMVHLSYGQGYGTGIHVDAHGVTVERVAPPEWPPLVGDLWRDGNGLVWFAYDATDYDDNDTVVIKLHSTSTYSRGTYPADDVNRRYGPMTLVHREASGAGA